MVLSKIFINEFGRLRSGWRVLLFIFSSIAASYVIVTAFRIAVAIVLAVAPSLLRPRSVSEIIYRLSLLASALVAGYLCARFLEGLPFRSLGLTLHTNWFKDLLIGFAIGFASLVVAVTIARLGGELNFSLRDIAVTTTGRSMVGSATLLFAAALAEEAMFRGYGLQTLTRAKLAWLGALLTSLLFGFAHLSNPKAVPLFTFLNTALAGLWLVVAYLRTRSLWFPLGVHWSWNWALGWFFGLPISGINLVSHPLLKADDNGPSWLTGGDYGIEGGLACTISLVLFTLFVWRTSLVSATPELKKLTSEENPATPPTVISIRPADDHA